MQNEKCAAPINVICIAAGQLRPWQQRIAKQLMLDNLDTGISVTELAEACALSRSHFTRKFKESTGVSPQQWLRQQRVQRSKALLASASMPLVDIAAECGFYDQSHFCRTFMKAEGMTPQTWQHQLQAAA